MSRSALRRVVASVARLGATAILSSATTLLVVNLAQPEPALTAEKPVVVVREAQQFPCSAGTSPTVTFDSEQALVEDYLALKRDLLDLRHAVDYDAKMHTVGPSVHEWADRKPAGTYGGGRKP